jgi:hypothetical protein
MTKRSNKPPQIWPARSVDLPQTHIRDNTYYYYLKLFQHLSFAIASRQHYLEWLGIGSRSQRRLSREGHDGRWKGRSQEN